MKRVGNANETSLQSVAIATGGAMMFRTDFRQTKGIPQTINIIMAGTIPVSENKQQTLGFEKIDENSE